MNNLLYKVLPMIIFMTLGQIMYLKFDKKYMLTNKISLKLKISQQWKPFFCFCCLIIAILIISVVDMIVAKNFKINIPDMLFSALCGSLIGIGIGIMNKMGNIKNM